MGYGDELLAAGQAQRHYDLTGQKSIIVDSRDRPRWHDIWLDNPVILTPEAANVFAGTGRMSQINVIRNAPGCRPYIVYPFTEETGWTFDTTFRARDHVAKIYLTETERAFGQQVADRMGDGTFVLIDPWSKHENLRWPIDHWQALVASRGDLTFVQHTYDTAPRIVAPNVFHVETFSFRRAAALLPHAAVYVRGESGMLHAAAALGAKTVAIWGGCMDWEVLGGYAGELGVGVAPSADICGCWKPCAHCAHLMRAITPEMVSDSIDHQRKIAEVWRADLSATQGVH